MSDWPHPRTRSSRDSNPKGASEEIGVASAASLAQAPFATPHGGAGGLARSGLSARLRNLLERWRSAEEARVLARFAGRRWTDRVEREVNEALCQFGRRADPFERS